MPASAANAAAAVVAKAWAKPVFGGGEMKERGGQRGGTLCYAVSSGYRRWVQPLPTTCIQYSSQVLTGT